MNPIGLIFAAAGHAKEAWAKRKEHGGSLKEAAKREAELTSRHTLKASALTVGARFVKDSRAMAARRGDYAMMMLYDLAHGVVARHEQKARHDQLTFELTKHVERGDTAHLSDKHLDHIVKNAEQFGGANAETIRAKAQAEKEARLAAKMSAKAARASANAAKAAEANAASKAEADAKRAAEKAAKDAGKTQQQAQRDAEKAARKAARETHNSPAAIQARALAKQQAQVQLMQTPEWKKMQAEKAKIKQELKASTKAANKEQQNNQKQRAQAKPGPGRPSASKQVQQSKQARTRTKSGPMQEHGPKGQEQDIKDKYDNQGRNKETGKLARGHTLSMLQDMGHVKVKAVAKGARKRARQPKAAGGGLPGA